MKQSQDANADSLHAACSAAACDTYCIHYEGNRPDIKGVTYQEAASELEVRHDWIPGQHQLRIVKIEKLPNSELRRANP